MKCRGGLERWEAGSGGELKTPPQAPRRRALGIRQYALQTIMWVVQDFGVYARFHAFCDPRVAQVWPSVGLLETSAWKGTKTNEWHWRPDHNLLRMVEWGLAMCRLGRFVSASVTAR